MCRAVRSTRRISFRHASHRGRGGISHYRNVAADDTAECGCALGIQAPPGQCIHSGWSHCVQGGFGANGSADGGVFARNVGPGETKLIYEHLDKDYINTFSGARNPGLRDDW